MHKLAEHEKRFITTKPGLQNTKCTNNNNRFTVSILHDTRQILQQAHAIISGTETHTFQSIFVKYNTLAPHCGCHKTFNKPSEKETPHTLKYMLCLGTLIDESEV